MTPARQSHSERRLSPNYVGFTILLNRCAGRPQILRSWLRGKEKAAESPPLVELGPLRCAAQ
jgi:hypothetical protein